MTVLGPYPILPNPGDHRPGGLQGQAPALTLGLLPPMAPGRMEPVSWYLHRILETQPWDTRNWREMTQGRIPWWAISTILWRMWLGSGLPLMNTPPSWLTRPWPRGVDTGSRRQKGRQRESHCGRTESSQKNEPSSFRTLLDNRHVTAIALKLLDNRLPALDPFPITSVQIIKQFRGTKSCVKGTRRAK